VLSMTRCVPLFPSAEACPATTRSMIWYGRCATNAAWQLRRCKDYGVR